MTDRPPSYEGERPKLTLKEVMSQIPPHLRGEAMLDMSLFSDQWVEHRTLELNAPDLVTSSPEEGWQIVDTHLAEVLEQEPELIDGKGRIDDRLWLLSDQQRRRHPVNNLPVVPSQIRINRPGKKNILYLGSPAPISGRYAEYFVTEELGSARLDGVGGITNVYGDGEIRGFFREKVTKKPGKGSRRMLSRWGEPITLYQTPVEGLFLYQNPDGTCFLAPEIRALGGLEKQLKKIPSERGAKNYIKREVSIAVREDGLSFVTSFGQLDSAGVLTEAVTGKQKREHAEKVEKAGETTFGKRILELKEKLIGIVDTARQHVPGEVFKPALRLDLGRETFASLRESLMSLGEYFILLDNESVSLKTEAYKNSVYQKHPQWRTTMNVLDEGEKTGVLSSDNARALSGGLTSLAILYSQLRKKRGVPLDF